MPQTTREFLGVQPLSQIWVHPSLFLTSTTPSVTGIRLVAMVNTGRKRTSSTLFSSTCTWETHDAKNKNHIYNQTWTEREQACEMGVYLTPLDSAGQKKKMQSSVIECFLHVRSESLSSTETIKKCLLFKIKLK